MSHDRPATATGAWVRIKIKERRRRGGHLLQFSREGTHEKLPIGVPAGKLATARTQMTVELRRLVNKVSGQLEWTPHEAGLVLRDFFRRAFDLGAAAMNNGSQDMIAIQDFLNRPKGWWMQGREHTPVVEVEGEDHDFPFELLPLLDHTRIEPPADKDDVLRLARRFLGFSCAVRRLGRSSVAPGWNLEGPTLPLSFIRHASLDGAQLEAEFFKSMSEYMEVDGPWPTEDVDEERLIANVADILFDGRCRLLADESDRFTQIHHFACHCEIGGEDGADEEVDDALIVSAAEDEDERHNRRFPLYRLSSEYASREPLSARAQESLPEGRGLVFLNACGSAFIDPARLTSLPQTFLSEQHRGVIGAATAVPDDLAAKFSTTFYRLLLAGRSLGTALVKARCWIVYEYGNPLGALYALYADPDVRLEPHLAQSRFQHRSFEM